MNNMVLGQYVPTGSKIHKIDPRVKISMMIILITSIFMVGDYWGYGLIFAFLLVSIIVSKLQLKLFLSAMKPMMWMMFFLFIINIFLLKDGELIWKFAFIEIYSQAIHHTLFIAFRLFLMVMVTTLLTASTDPLELTLGIEDLLSPLRKFKVPSHEIAMMITLALRFIPTLIEDTYRIMNAQASRGVDFEEGKFKEKISAVISLIVPLFVSVFQRAEDLADAMEARGYFPGKERTRYKQLKLKGTDFIYLTLCIGLLFGVRYIG